MKKRSTTATKSVSKVLYLMLSVLLFFINNSIVLGQPSLAAGDIRELVIKYDDKQESYTLLQDAVNCSQWYYVPKEPRLSEILINGKPNPEFTLLRYQFVDPHSENHSFDGGIVQFSVVLSPQPKALLALDSTAKAEIGNPNLSLSALPLKSAQASIYTLGGADSSRLVSKSFGTGLFPTFASQKVPFALYLTRWGADINDALIGNSVSSNTGIPLAVTFTYQGLTPPAHLKIKANYSKILDHYSQDKTFAAKVSYFGLFGASTQMRWSTINETLKVDGALTVEKIGNSEISDSTMDIIMQSVMKRINDMIIKVTSPPPAIPPASAEMPTFNDRFGGVGYNVTTKHVTYKSDYVDSFEWDERKLVERSTLAGGFIGLGKYDSAIRACAVQFVPGFDWDMAYFDLPDIGNLTQLTQVIINTDLFNRNVHVSTKSGKWTPNTGWRSVPNGDSITTLDFAIAPLLKNGTNRDNLKFITTTTVLQAGKQTILKDTQNVIQGSIPIAPPSEGLSTITFDPMDLQFKNINNTDGKLLRVSVTMSIAGKTFSDYIQPILNNGHYQNPNALVWVLKNDDLYSAPIKVTIKYDYTNGTNPLSRTVPLEDFLKANDQQLNYLLRDPAMNQ